VVFYSRWCILCIIILSRLQKCSLFHGLQYVDKVPPWPHRQFSEVHKISTNYKISTPINIPNRLGIHNNALYQQKTAKCECWLLFLMESLFNCRAWKVQISYSYFTKSCFPITCFSVGNVVYEDISRDKCLVACICMLTVKNINSCRPTDQLVPYTASLCKKKLKSTHQVGSRFKLSHVDLVVKTVL
jgi:hypothetical protein